MSKKDKQSKQTIIILVVLGVVVMVGLIWLMTKAMNVGNEEKAAEETAVGDMEVGERQYRGMDGEITELPASITNQMTGKEMTLDGPMVSIAGQYLLDVPAGTKLDGIFQLDIDSQGGVEVQAYDRPNEQYVVTQGTVSSGQEGTGALVIAMEDDSSLTYQWQEDGGLNNAAGEVFKVNQSWEDRFRMEVEMQDRYGFKKDPLK